MDNWKKAVISIFVIVIVSLIIFGIVYATVIIPRKNKNTHASVTTPIIQTTVPKTNGRYASISKTVDDGLRLDTREIQVYSEGVNVAVGAKVTSTCGENLQKAPMTSATDNNLDTSASTMWAKDCQDNGNNGLREITVDLGKNYPIDKVVVYGSVKGLVNKNQAMVMTIKDNDNKIIYKSTPILTDNLDHAVYNIPDTSPLEVLWD